jgi:3-oxoacyl-[acyl-carrier-protein] synthase III
MLGGPLPVGIYGVGIGMPDVVRRNDAWPKSFSERFEQRSKNDFTTPDATIKSGATPAQESALSRMHAMRQDVFRGSVERRVHPMPLPVSILEIKAAREALDASGVDRREIGLLITHSIPADSYEVPTNAAIIARALEIPNVMCFDMSVGCCAFNVAMDYAARLIATGFTRHALIVTSLLLSRFVNYDDPASVGVGDGAGAAVLGPASKGRGILGTFMKTELDLWDGLYFGTGKQSPWYDGGGALKTLNPNLASARQMVISSGDYCRDTMNEVIQASGMTRRDVRSFFTTQQSAWFNDVCRATADLSHTLTMDTFRQFAHIGPAAVPANLYFGLKEGLVRDDDVVALFACGAGFTRVATLMRWGR